VETPKAVKVVVVSGKIVMEIVEMTIQTMFEVND
jgi:hypothetical protein